MISWVRFGFAITFVVRALRVNLTPNWLHFGS